MKPMLLTMSEEIPRGKDWAYEIKYDGFRAILQWTADGITLTSRNGKNLSDQFPEILELAKITDKPELPIRLDGELTILNTLYQANFALLQHRGRLKSKTKIQAASLKRPATFMAFDMQTSSSATYDQRKETLKSFIKTVSSPRLQYVEDFNQLDKITDLAFLHLAEGIVAKSKKSTYQEGKRSKQWLKIKQWRTVSGFLSDFDANNSYYYTNIWTGNKASSLGSFKHGLTAEEAQTLRTFFKKNGKRSGQRWKLDPGICVDLHCLGAKDGELREPLFADFRFDLSHEECTAEKVKYDLTLMPEDAEITKPDKKLWPDVTKLDYLLYLRQISPYQLPFLNNKKITLIRYPDGIHEQSFYQKHLPDYAPDYIQSWQEEGEMFILANNLQSLLWMGNHGALEYHIPFQTVDSAFPNEIVFDLDPPDREHFQLAILAAQLLKHLLDRMEVHSFAKTSGNKGMQIHIPLMPGSMSYVETRRFTEGLVRLLVKEEPGLFTIERLKKNRGNRLYLDYIQHAEGKTIIAPYSPRATKEATVAAPVFWEEVNESLNPTDFTIFNVVDRVKECGCPFYEYSRKRQIQPVEVMKSLSVK